MEHPKIDCAYLNDRLHIQQQYQMASKAKSQKRNNLNTQRQNLPAKVHLKITSNGFEPATARTNLL